MGGAARGMSRERCGRRQVNAGRTAIEGRTIPHFIDFLCEVDAQIEATVEWIYATLENLKAHHCKDLLLFMVHHPRWEFVYQPTYAAYLNLIEPW